MANAFTDRCLQKELELGETTELLLAEPVSCARFLVVRLSVQVDSSFAFAGTQVLGQKLMVPLWAMISATCLLLQPSVLKDHRQQASCHDIVLRNLG